MYSEKIGTFVQKCKDEPVIKSLQIFQDKGGKNPTLVNEIESAINAFKINEFLGKSNLTNHCHELKKIANRVLADTKKPTQNNSDQSSSKNRNAGNFHSKQNKAQSLDQSSSNDSTPANPRKQGNKNFSPREANTNTTFVQKGQQAPPNEVPPLLDNDFYASRNNNNIGFTRGQIDSKRGKNNPNNVRRNPQARNRKESNISEDDLGNSSFENRSRRNSFVSEASSTVSETARFQRQNPINSNIFCGPICPLCFEGFQAPRELGIHLQFRCPVVREGVFKEPDGFTMFQIIDRKTKCNPCKLNLVDNWIGKHIRDEHANDTSSCLVNVVFCAICNEFVASDIIAQHRGSAYHNKMVRLRNDQPESVILLLRKNSYCMLCKMFVSPKITLEKHIMSKVHVSKCTQGECNIICFHCGPSVHRSDVQLHLQNGLHIKKSAQYFHCQFCNSEYTIDQFLGHIKACVSVYSN